MKKCSKCKREKTEEEFYANRPTRRCKVCLRQENKVYLKSYKRKLSGRQKKKKVAYQKARREAELKKDPRSSFYKTIKYEYGLSKNDYEAMVAAQGGRCAICHEHFKGARDRHIDHDHLTGSVRGLLCKVCNIGLGMFQDSARLLRVATAYLESKSEGADPLEFDLTGYSD